MHCVMKNSKGCLKHCTSTVVVHYLVNKFDHPPLYHAAYRIAGYFQIFMKSGKRPSELNFVVLTLNSTHDTRNRMHSQTLAVCIHLWSYHFSVQRELKSTLLASDLCKALTFHWHFPLKSLSELSVKAWYTDPINLTPPFPTLGRLG